VAARAIAQGSSYRVIPWQMGVLAKLLRYEDIQRSADIRHRRQALLEAGAPLTEDTLGTREPRRGYMRL